MMGWFGAAMVERSVIRGVDVKSADFVLTTVLLRRDEWRCLMWRWIDKVVVGRELGRAWDIFWELSR